MSDCGMKDLLSGEENVRLNSIDCLRAFYKKTREIEQLMMFIYYDLLKFIDLRRSEMNLFLYGRFLLLKRMNVIVFVQT